jgi:hypothetical protein
VSDVLGFYGFWRPHLVLRHRAGVYHGHVPLYTSKDCDLTASRIDAYISGGGGLDKPLT